MFFFVWRLNKAAPSLNCQLAQWRDFEQTEPRCIGLNREAARHPLVTYESCIVPVSYMTCDHFRSHMIDVATVITRIKKHFLIINIMELDLNMILLAI